LITGQDTAAGVAVGFRLSQTAAGVARHFQVVELLAEVDPDEVCAGLAYRINPQLEDTAPATAIGEGRARDVVAAAQAFVNAV
jgi:hypothetical protein